MADVPSLPLRKLKAQMALKALELYDVSRLSGVPYTTCSQILNGRLVHPEHFASIRAAITAAPQPKETAAA